MSFLNVTVMSLGFHMNWYLSNCRAWLFLSWLFTSSCQRWRLSLNTEFITMISEQSTRTNTSRRILWASPTFKLSQFGFFIDSHLRTRCSWIDCLHNTGKNDIVHSRYIFSFNDEPRSLPWCKFPWFGNCYNFSRYKKMLQSLWLHKEFPIMRLTVRAPSSSAALIRRFDIVGNCGACAGLDSWLSFKDFWASF